MYRSLCLLLFAGFFFGCGEHQSAGQSVVENSTDQSDQYFDQPGDFAGSHILIAYQGAQRANPTITRTKEEALARAKELIAEIKKDPSKFEEIAKTDSDGPSGTQGGSLGSWQKGQMVPEFDAAVETMEIGAITDEPVETGFGYHIIRRNDMKVKHYAAYGFFVAYKGDPRLPETVTRTQPEAETLSNELKEKCTPENFDELANEHNDLGDGSVFIGVLREGDAQSADFITALEPLGYGEVGGPVSLPVGYAFVKRVKVEQRAGAHILVAYQGAERANPEISRSKDEAQARAQELITELKADPARFAALAQANSDGPSGPNGGDLGTWFRGQMVPEFDVAMDDLAVGAIADQPVESPFGYHIILRKAAE